MKLMREKLAARRSGIKPVKTTPERPVVGKTSSPKISRLTRRSLVASSSSTTTSSECSTSSIGDVKKVAVSKEFPTFKKFSVSPSKSAKVSEVSRSTLASPKTSSIQVNKRLSTPVSTSKLKIALKRKSSTPANDRLQELQKSLTEDDEEPNTKKKSRFHVASDKSDISLSFSDSSKLPPKPTDRLRQKAQSRLYSVEKRLDKNSALDLKKYELENKDKENDSQDHTLNRIKKSKSFDDQMDWEPIEDEKILSEVRDSDTSFS